MKRVLILGAGLMQLPAIDAARELGCHITLVDADPNAVCVSLADRFEAIDLKDVEALVILAKDMKNHDGIDAVFTAGTDFSYSVSYICEAVGLCSHSVHAAINASDKIHMRKCFRDHDVPSPHFIEIKERDMIDLKENSVFFEDFYHEGVLSLCVVKPCDNMGSRGCRMVSSFDELINALENALSFSRSKRAIVEEYMDGAEFSIDALFFNNELTIAGFADRHIYYPPYFIETGHTMPSSVSQNEKNALFECFFEGVKSLGLSCGAVKADIKLTSKGPMIGEIAARLSGGYMSGWTFPFASGLNLTKQALLLSLGKTPFELLQKRKKTDIGNIYEVSCKSSSAERAWISIPGIVSSIYNLEAVSKMKGVKEVLPRLKKGSQAVFPLNNVEKAGNIIVKKDSASHAARAAEHATAKIIVRLEVDNKKTEDFLRAPLATSFPPSAYPFVETETIKRFVRGEANVAHSILNKKDWNRRSLKKLLCDIPFLLDEYCGIKKESFLYKNIMENDFFYHALLRGGIQGMLYVCDMMVLHGADYDF